MKPEFISHPDFAALEHINVFHKEFTAEGKTAFNPMEKDDLALRAHPEELINRHIIYRRRVELSSSRSAILSITADDYYKLYINGDFVCQGPTTGYPNRYYYNEIDVSAYLREGENFFAVHTYYQGLYNRVWVSGDLRQMLWLSLEQDGERTLVSDRDWLVKYHTGYTALHELGCCTAFAERYDAASEDARFFFPESSDEGYVNAETNTTADYTLVKQPTKPLAVYDMLPEWVEGKDWGLRLAMPTEAVGSLRFTAKGEAGQEIILRYGEELNEDGSVRYDMRCGCLYEERMILSGGEDKADFFDYKAFRYAELHFPRGVRISDLSMQVRHYPMPARLREYRGFSPELQAVIALSANTIKYGAQEQFLDCMTREKGAYLGDLMVSGRAYTTLTGDTELLKLAVENSAATASVCGGLMAVAGCSFMQEIADYSLEFPAILPWIYSIDSDIDFLRRMEPYALSVYNYFKEYEDGDGLISSVKEKWNMVDWPANLRDGYDFELTRPIGEGRHNVLNALWYGLKLAMEEIYSILGKKGDFGTERTLKGFCKCFYNEKTGLFADREGGEHSAVQSSVFPLLFGMYGQSDGMRSRLVQHIAQKGLTSMGVYTAYFALSALKRVGEYPLATRLAEDTGAWLNMIAEGATTTFEAWGKDQKWNTSLFHPWATAPLVVFADGVREY